MKITLITPSEYKTLVNIQDSHPYLTYQNRGYDGVDRRKFTEKDKIADTVVSNILRKSIVGFKRFQNFKVGRDGDIQIRFQYNYGYNGGTPFTGVGYIKIIELLNGFISTEK